MFLEQADQIPKIVVAVRKRPMSKKELAKGELDIVEVKQEDSTVIVRETRTKVDLTKYIDESLFNFDAAIDEYTTNEQLYLQIVRPIVEAAFNRSKVTCFAYGQTGSGKTYTMLGDVEQRVPGLYLLAAYDIFSLLEESQYQHFQITLSFYEIYCGKLFDLLNERSQLQAREDAKGNVNIVGLQERKVLNVEQLMKIIEQGSAVRVTSQNSANTDSSRSHAILQILLKDNNRVHGKLSFIDLAGSERGADVIDQNKQTRIDGAEINKSLLALKECIRALDQNKNHTPFRGSKLTLVLKDSFVGNCKTVMIGNFSPSNASAEHTLNTLRYADRVKELRKPNTGEIKEQVGSLDKLARELMLPRQNNQRNDLIGGLYQQQYQPQPYNVQQYQIQQQFSQQSSKKKEQIPSKMPIKNVPVQNLFQQQLMPLQQQTNFQNLQQQQQPRFDSQAQKPHKSSYSGQLENQQNLINSKVTRQTDNELSKMNQKHEQLIQQILEAEENLIASHKAHIDQMVEQVKVEMNLLNAVDRAGSDVDQYVNELDNILRLKYEKIIELRLQLQTFRAQLAEEQKLLNQFNQCKNNQICSQPMNQLFNFNSFDQENLLQ